jgi:O-antigen/teichoic acid export membrane protein
MLKQVISHSIIYSAAGLFTGGALFFVLPIYTRLFSVADYGVYEYLSIIGTLVGVTVGLEVTQAVARFVAEVRNDARQVRKFASTALWFTLCMHLLVISAVGLFADGLSMRLLGSERYTGVLLAAIVSFAMAGATNVMVTQLQWELRAKESAFLSAVIALSSIGLSITFVWGLGMGLMGAFLGPVAGGLFMLPLGLWLANGSFGLTFSFPALRQMMAFSFPLVFSSVGWVLSSYLDRLAIKELMTFADVAIYGVGFRIAGIVMLLMTGLQGAVGPMIFAHHQEPKTPGLVAEMLRLFTAVAVVICAGLSVFSPELLVIFATTQYKAATLVIPFLAVSIVLSRCYVFAPGIFLEKKTVLLAGINIVMAFLNIGLNYVLIPQWGIMGAALATLIAACTFFASIMYFSQRYYRVPHRLAPLVLLTVSGVVVMLGTAWGYYTYQIGFVLRLLVFLLICSLPLLFGVVRMEECSTAMRWCRNQFPKGN